MQGLLDFLKTPEGQGLLSGAFGMAAGARRGTPWNNLGRGGLAGLAGYSNAIEGQKADEEAKFQKQYRQMQMDDLTRKATQQKAQENWWGGLPGMTAPKFQGQDQASTMIADQMSGFGEEALPYINSLRKPQGMESAIPGLGFGADKQGLEQYMLDPASPFKDELIKKQLFPDPEEFGTTPFPTADGSLYVTGKKGTLKPLGVKGKPDAPPKLGTLNIATKGGMWQAYQQNPDGTPNMGAPIGVPFRKSADAAEVNNSNTNLNTQEDKQSQVYGGGLGEVRKEIQTAGFKAPVVLSNLNRMEQLLRGIDGGTLAPTGAQIANIAQGFGINLDPRLGDKEAAESLAREMALSLRQPGSGPMTDKDFENFMQIVPSLSKTAQGRSQIITTLRAKVQRDVQIAKMARDYAKNNRGVIDDGFLDQVAQFQASNPIFRSPDDDLFNAADAVLKGGRP
jgi:hypothetical protein